MLWPADGAAYRFIYKKVMIKTLAGTQQERGTLQLAGEYQEPAGRVPQEQVQGALQLVGGRHQPAAVDAQHRLGLLEVDVCQESDEPSEDNYPWNISFISTCWY